MMILDLKVLWQHYSSYFLTAIVVLGGLNEYVGEIAGIPHWITIVLAICALISKTIPQKCDDGK